MTVEKVVCDECGRTKKSANHWHQIGVIPSMVGGPWIELGSLAGPHSLKEYTDAYQVLDLCGEQCFLKHICKLLQIGGPLAKLDGSPEAQ